MNEQKPHDQAVSEQDVLELGDRVARALEAENQPPKVSCTAEEFMATSSIVWGKLVEAARQRRCVQVALHLADLLRCGPENALLDASA